jgi:hypothetical protein
MILYFFSCYRQRAPAGGDDCAANIPLSDRRLENPISDDGRVPVETGKIATN